MNPRREPWMPGHLVVFDNGIERTGSDIRPPYSRDERDLILATDEAIFSARHAAWWTHVKKRVRD